MMAACVVGMVALLFVRETAGCSLRGREMPGTVAREAEGAAAIRQRDDDAGGYPAKANA
jgi:hypothetical protein